MVGERCSGWRVVGLVVLAALGAAGCGQGDGAAAPLPTRVSVAEATVTSGVAPVTEALARNTAQPTGKPAAVMVAGGRTVLAIGLDDVTLWCRDDGGALGHSCHEGGGADWVEVASEASPVAGAPVRPNAGVNFNGGALVVGSSSSATSGSTAAVWVRRPTGEWLAASRPPTGVEVVGVTTWFTSAWAMVRSLDGSMSMWSTTTGLEWSLVLLPPLATGTPTGRLTSTTTALFIEYDDPAAEDGLTVWSTRNLREWLPIWLPPGVTAVESRPVLFTSAGSQLALVTRFGIRLGDVGSFGEVEWQPEAPLPSWPSAGVLPAVGLGAAGLVVYDNHPVNGRLWRLDAGPSWAPLSDPAALAAGADAAPGWSVRIDVLVNAGDGLALVGASGPDGPAAVVEGGQLAVWDWTAPAA